MPELFNFTPTMGGPQVRAFRLEPEHTERFLTPHAHRFFEIVYFEEPGGIHRLGDLTWESAAGDLLIIPPGQVHEWAEDVLEKQATIWILEFTAAALDPAKYVKGSLLGILQHPFLAPFAFGSRHNPLRLNVPPNRRPEWESALRALEAERLSQESYWEEAAHALLVLLLVKVCRISELEHPSTHAHTQPLLKQVFDVIDAHYAESLSLSDVAKAVHYSPAHLTTTIRRLTGRTVGEWILWRRMTEARHLLVHTEMKITEIAEKVGYADPSHFNRLFRREIGSPPGGWRDVNR
ncbi:MAG: AraC family transcriptional regulator [Rhodothermales bacterium]|nr:AraC family transcriptional regulator [Rhodothermales bacterium]